MAITRAGGRPRAGTLDKRVMIQSPGGSADGGGGVSETWSDVTEVWAAIRSFDGQERFRAQQVQAALTAEVEIMYRTGVTPQMRFKYGARAFHIAQPAIDPRERHERLIFVCEERDA